jgi:hypothetical protein
MNNSALKTSLSNRPEDVITKRIELIKSYSIYESIKTYAFSIRQTNISLKADLVTNWQLLKKSNKNISWGSSIYFYF